MGSQPLSQMGREAASSAPSAVGQLLHQRKILRFFDAAAHAHDHLRRAQIDGLRRSAEWLAGLGANLRGFELRRECRDRRGAGALR